jgi:uncharacterized repeat protein (TIGR01451 family)
VKNLFPISAALQSLCSGIFAGAQALVRLFAGEFDSSRKGAEGPRPLSRPFRAFAAYVLSFGPRSCAAFAALYTSLFFILSYSPALWAATPAGTAISNTAAVTYTDGPSSGLISRNSNSFNITTVTFRTPATIELLQYAPTMPPGVQMVAFSPSWHGSSVTGPFTGPMGPPVTTGGSTISSPAPLAPASLYHAGDPVFIRLTDLDQNQDPAVAETVVVTVRDDLSGDVEYIRLNETGPNTGVFVGYVQSTSLALTLYDGALSVANDSRITASYVDPADSTDSKTAVALVDPYGKVFSSATGQLMNGVSVTLIDAATNLPATTIKGDDGVSAFPPTVVTGSPTKDGGGKIYSFPPGEFRFPFIPTGTYRLTVAPPAGYRAPSTVPTASLQSLPGGPFVIVAPGSRGETFTVASGSVIRMDVPIDPAGNRLFLTKSAANSVTAIGDFLQYRLSVQNTDPTGPVLSVVVSDALPLGFRYRNGSTKINTVAAPDPVISGDGRSLTFTVGTIAPATTTNITYVTEVAAGASTGMAVNTAVAAGTGAVSNPATASVLVKNDFFSDTAFIMGTVRVDGCGKSEAAEKAGLEGVRLFMEDGTYIVTDKNGMFHFEGVKPGTHVVQLDLETLPEKYEVLSCEDNDRFAETAFSQFVDLQGGTLWRIDFHLGLKAYRTGEAGLELRSVLRTPQTGGNTIEYSIPVHVGSVPLRNVRVSVMLPEGTTYQAGSSMLNTAPQPDPSNMENALTFSIGDVPADWEGTVRFNCAIPAAGTAGELATKALLFFDTPQKKNERTPVVDNLLVRKIVEERQSVPDIVLHPKFAVLSAALNKKDKKALDRLIKDMKESGVKNIIVTGHTDSGKIKGRAMKKFKDNYALSQARAETVGRYIAAGLKLSPEQVTFIGKGPDEPIASNKTGKGRAQNRRVELQVETEKAIVTADLKNEKDASGVKTVTTTGLRPGEKWAEPETKKPVQDEKKMPEYTPEWIASTEPGFAWLWPGEGYYPAIPATKIAIKHDPEKKLKLFLNGEEVNALYLDGTLKRQDGKVAVSVWRGVNLRDGDNFFEAIQYDENGAEAGILKRVMHYSTPPVKAELAPAQSKLVADGKNPPVLAVLLTDKDGHPAREGVVGEYSIDPPHVSRQRAEDLQKNPLTAPTSDKLKYQVGTNGIALIELQPTTRTGAAVIRIPLYSGEQEIRAWLAPEKRDWILVGLADGTVGYNTVKNHMESAGSGENDQYYKDERIAFYAKGSIKGEWLLTMAYDSDKNGNQDQKKLYQQIDPNKYYTLYGDATDQRADAASSKSLYLKIERDQFYALFGDYDTGLTVTELSRYSRQFNGVKSELKSEHFDYTLFGSQNDQTFVKDEIQGDGTSGLYRLSRNNIIINSDSIVIETRDRFRSEVILSTQPMSRFVDYSIDYETGTVWFKSPVFSRDANFNPIFIVARYEVFDTSAASYNYGGRGALKTLNNKVEVGATGIHEEQNGGKGDLTGMDATVKLDEHTKVRAELSKTKNDESGAEMDGTAWLAEVSHRSDKFDGRAYIRELEPGFGLGQQNNSETGTRKSGYDLTYRMNQSFSLQSDAFRQENLTTNAVRDMAELQGNYHDKRYELFSGVRYAQDTFDDGTTQTSDQIFVGSRYQMTDRLSVSMRRDQSIGNENENSDFPTRTTLGADYKLTESSTLFAAQEWTRGAQLDTSTSRVGLRSTPWTGGQVSSTVENQTSENGERLFSTLGLKQTWQVSKRWTVDAGLDRSETIKDTTSSSTTAAPQQFNSNVPPASGGPTDFTAVSLGAGYAADKWSWTGRVEERFSADEKKFGVFSGVNGEASEGLGLAAGVQVFQSSYMTGARTENDDVRIGLVYRPKNSDWIVLDRLDLLVDERRDVSFNYDNWRVVNNMNTNYKVRPDTQLSLQYACKFVRETIDDLDYRGYTDLTGLEARYDLTKKWDIGVRGKMLHSWSVNQYQYGTGLSLGYNFVKNALIRVGYNITGFRDKDFSKADFTSQGPYIKLSLKFDQVSVRSAVKWITGM